MSIYLRAGIVNVHATSDPRRMARWLENFADSLDFLFLQEVTQAHRAQFAARLSPEWWFRGRWMGGNETAMVLGREEVFPSPSATYYSVGTGWWGHQVGRQHAPRTLPLVVTNGILLGSIHAPPGVDFKPENDYPTGPEDRVRAYRRYMKDLRRAVEEQVAEHEPKGIILAGDWNESIRSEGRRSPAWLAAKLGLWPTVGVGIDYAMRSGFSCPGGIETHAKGPGMDHHPRIVKFRSEW